MAKHRRAFIYLFIYFISNPKLFVSEICTNYGWKIRFANRYRRRKISCKPKGTWRCFWRFSRRRKRIENLPPAELDTFLSGFLLSVRKKSGKEYEATPRRGFITSVERHLTKNGDSLIMGQPFAITWDALKSKQKQLRRLSKGNKPREAASLDQNEIDLLFKKEVMGIHLPQALINILRFNNCLHFGIRGGKEQRNLSYGDVVLKPGCPGKWYLDYSTERETKIRPGDNLLNRRQIKPRMYENLSVSDEGNPISSYKLYMTKRPKETLVAGSPFYSTVNDHSKEKSALSSAKWLSFNLWERTT